MGEKLSFVALVGLLLLVFASRVRADLPIGLRLDGESPNDFFGASVAGAGDVNGDGVPDIIVGAPQADPGGRTDAGSAFVFSGANGARLFRFDGQAAGDCLGFQVASAGDVNGDGRPDFVVGATGADARGRSDAGSAFVFSGANGAQLSRFDGEAAGDMLGSSAASAGDVNGDGVPDIIVGAPGADPGGRKDAGSAFVFSGANGARLFRFDGEAAGDMLGFSAAGVGDVNGDGVPDIVAGAPFADPGGRENAGSAFVFSGATGALVWRFDGEGKFGYWDCLGFSVAGTGDVNGDGKGDVIVGAPGWYGGLGQAVVFSGATGSAFITEWGYLSGGQLVGYWVAGAGDVNGDGAPDFIVGGPGLGLGGGTNAGGAYVDSGATGARVKRFEGPAAWDRLGSSVAWAGDLNGDGLDDVIISAIRWHPESPPEPGSVWVVTPVGPSLVINPPPIPGGAVATNNPVVNLLLPAVGASTMELKEEGQASWSGPFPYSPRRSWTLASGEGLRRIYARYHDFSGKIMTEVSDDIILDQSPPGVSIRSPAPGSVVEWVVAVMADASDAVSGVAGVMFKLDGNPVLTDTSAPYQWNWDTRATSEGVHTLAARALDQAGNYRETEITVTVDNPTFYDVPRSHPFWAFIESIFAAGLTSGCKTSPLRYCPDGIVTRGQIAKFLCLAAGKTELNSSTPIFADVPKTHLFYGWIERLADASSWRGNPPTSGCRTVGTARYFCPGYAVTRGEMAKVLCKAAGKTPPNAPAPTFSDVPTTHPFYAWIERLVDAASWGGTPPVAGCTPTTFCPGGTVTRAEMAKFLVLAFRLPYYQD
jgi:hypothetical protein